MINKTVLILTLNVAFLESQLLYIVTHFYHFHKKNGRQVVNPNKIPAITPPIRRENAILSLNGTLFTISQIATKMSMIAINEPNATQ